MKTWIYGCDGDTETETEVYIKATRFWAARAATFYDPPEEAGVDFYALDAAGNLVELTDEQEEEIRRQLLEERGAAR